METSYFNQTELGWRIADARRQAQRSQVDLAAEIQVDRTAIAKIESGTRKVTAVELARIAATLGYPIDWFLVKSPSAVVSRRAALDAPDSPALDRALDLVARDVEFLSTEGILEVLPEHVSLQLHPLQRPTDAEPAAAEVRQALALPDGPLPDLNRAAERLGLLAFSLDLGQEGGDAAYVSLDDFGVTVVNGAADPGRRRFTLAHELGHHLFQDAYATDLALADVGEPTEQRINAFAAYLLMPRSSLVTAWNQQDVEPRLRAIRIAADYRVSWSALCMHLRTLKLVTPEACSLLRQQAPTRADYLELGVRFEQELQPPEVPGGYASQVLRAYQQRRLGAGRVLELLHGELRANDLPEPRPLPMDDLRPDFDPMR